MQAVDIREMPREKATLGGDKVVQGGEAVYNRYKQRNKTRNRDTDVAASTPAGLVIPFSGHAMNRQSILVSSPRRHGNGRRREAEYLGRFVSRSKSCIPQDKNVIIYIRKMAQWRRK